MLKTKIKTFVSMPRLVALAGLALLVFLSLNSPLRAQTVTQGYGSDGSLQRGMIVRLKEDDTSKVEAVSQDTIEDMHGVVVDANDAPVTLSSEGQKVFVATTGHFDVLVSDQNGAINAGDYITVSALHGIGMKAGDKDLVIVGRALAGFNGQDGAIGSSEVKNSAGATQKVNLGRVSADISVARNPLLKATEPNIPDFLRKAAESVAGKPVNTSRVYLSVLIFIISTILAAGLMYSGVRSSIISIGRNPLSKKSIIRGMLQVILTGLIIFLTGLFGVYLLLKL